MQFVVSIESGYRHVYESSACWLELLIFYHTIFEVANGKTHFELSRTLVEWVFFDKL